MIIYLKYISDLYTDKEKPSVSSLVLHDQSVEYYSELHRLRIVVNHASNL